MATVRFTQNIQRHVECPPLDVAGETVREVLETYFRNNEPARGYVLDEHGAVRKHMVVFVNGRQIADREQLTDPITATCTIDVMQALSGG